MSRATRLTKRIVLGFLGLIVVIVAGVLITLHTDYGRGLIRTQVEARLDDMLVGGAKVGAVEGSPLGELVLHDIVLNGPDKKPAITIGKLTLELGIMPLFSKQARIAGLEAEDVDVILKRDPNGELQISRMKKPSDQESGWSVDIPDVIVRRAHVALETGQTGKDAWVNLDGIQIFGAVHMPKGEPLDANVSIRGTWRERAAGIGVDAVVSVHEKVIHVPSVIAMVGGVTVAGTAVRIVAAANEQPMVDGLFVVNAPAAAVAQLAPEIELPADIAITATARTELPWTQVSLVGQVGTTPVRAMLSADLGKKRALGVVSSGLVDVTKLSGGKVPGSGAGVVIFDAALGRDGELPVASGVITAWGELMEAPYTQAAIAFNTDGERASTVVGVAGQAVKATLHADVKKIGEAITLERSRLIASTPSPAKATGGKAPVHGSLTMNLSASGALAPNPNLAVRGRVDGRRLAMQGLRVSTLELAVAAKGLPKQPIGKLELEMDGIVNNKMQLGELKVTAANRSDGKIAVAVRSRPKANPWLLDVDALVTPPGTGDTTTINIVGHHVRAAKGGDWYGNSGLIVIGPRQIEVRDLRSKGAEGAVAVAGAFVRAGRDKGDIVAKVDATSLDLDNLNAAYRGRVNAHVDVARTNGRWEGDVKLDAKGVAADRSTLTFDVDADIHGEADKLVVDAKASSARVGSARVMFDVDAPKNILDGHAWTHLHREVIRQGQISFEGVDLARVAELAGRKGELSGVVDGDILINSKTVGGIIKVRDVMTPQLRTTGTLDADLQVSQTDVNEIVPTLTGKVNNFGTFFATAQFGIPDHLFNPIAWRNLGKGAFRGASARIQNVHIDPGLLDRFGVVTQLRGRASASAEIAAGMRSAQVALDLTELRGTPIADPVTAHFAVAIDDKAANTSLVMRSDRVTLFEMKGTVPVSIEQLRADPQVVKTMPLDMTAKIPNAPAPTVLGVFGRTEVIGGVLNGTVKVAGTVAKPTVVANFVATDLKVPPGPNNKPIKTIENITVDGSWDGVTGKLRINGRQQNGKLEVVASASPGALDKGTLTIVAKQFDLVPLLVFAPGPAGAGAGRLDANLRVVGLDPVKAKVTGELHLTGGRFPIAPTIGTLRRAKVDVVIGNEMKVSVTGRLGGGDLTLKSTIGLDGAQPTGGDAVITLRKVSPIGSVEPDIDANIKAKLRKEPGRWVADVFVHNASVIVPKGRGEKLKPIGAPSDMVFATGKNVAQTPVEREPPKKPTIVAHVTMYATFVESPEFRGIIKGKLTLSADAENVGIVGVITADRGNLDLFGRRYQVERAAVRFDGATDPLLDLRITHDFPEVTTVTQVRGRLSKPELIMSSNPGIYSQGQLLGFLLGGEPTGEPGNASARDRVTSAGTSFVANKIGGYVRNALPVDIDVLRYEASTAGSSAAVIVGTWLTRSLFLAYRRHIEARPDENASEGEVEYWLSRRVMVEAVVGDRGHHGIDLLWRKRY